MAYVGYIINQHLVYDNLDETISGSWTYNGETAYNALVTYNSGLTVEAGTSTFGGNTVFNAGTTFNSTINAKGSITSSAANSWSGTQNISGNISSSGTNTWTGNNTFTKTVNATAYNSLYGDIAELFEFDFDNIKQKDYNMKKYKGYIVEISSNNKKVCVCKPNSKSVLGIVSGNPGFCLNDRIINKKVSVPVAYLGRVDCYVIGKVKCGDKLTTSKIPGVAKKMTFLDKLLRKPVVALACEKKLNEEIYQIEVVVK